MNKHLQDVIDKNKVIELELFNGEMYQDCVCLDCNEDIWKVVNYDVHLNKYDGFSIFKNKDVNQYSVYKKKYLQMDTDGEKYSNDIPHWLLQTKKIENILFKLKDKQEITAFFMDLEEYYIGIISSIEFESISIKLISTEFEFLGEEKFQLDDILYISFGTQYEKKIQSKLFK